MDVERSLVSKIASTGALEKAISKGIAVEHFADEECRAMFEFMVMHARKYKSAPSLEAAKERFPEFEFEHVQDSLEYVCDRFGALVRKALAQELLFELGEAITDPTRVGSIELEFLEAAREIATTVPAEDVARLSDMDKRVDEYEKEAEKGVLAGIPFGFPFLDQWTGGIQSYEFVTAAAFSGVGKSTLLRTIAFNIFSKPEDYIGLYISLEEDRKAILRKFDAMVASIDYGKMKQLGLDGDVIETWRHKAEKVKKKMGSNDVLILDRIRGCTPDKIFAETIRHKPDIVFIDYLSLMRSSQPSGRGNSQWQSLTEITQDLKQNARVLEVPIIAAAQTNRAGAKDGADLDNIGYALSVVQDSDIVLGLHADDEMKNKKEMELRVIKNREGRLGNIACIWNHDNMDFREKTHTDKFGKGGKVNGDASPAFTKKKYVAPTSEPKPNIFLDKKADSG